MKIVAWLQVLIFTIPSSTNWKTLDSVTGSDNSSKGVKLLQNQL